MAVCFPFDAHIVLITLLVLIWYHFKNAYDKYRGPKIPFVEPVFLFGNITKSMLRMQHLIDDISDVYHKFSDHKYVGFFLFDKPAIIIRDPEIIKQITVKDFEHFLKHQSLVNEDNDPLFGKNLFSLHGNKWTDMRSTLSPAFTGSKMKGMCSFMTDCGHQVNEYLISELSKSKPGDKKSACLEIKDLCTRYTTDVIATTTFGVKVDSLLVKDNEFYLTGKKTSNFTGNRLLKFVGFIVFPKLMTMLRIRLFSDEVCNFYRNLVHKTMQFREEKNIHRPDMIHLLMEAKKGTLKYDEQADGGKVGFATVEESKDFIKAVKRKWEDDELTAQAVLFFLGGFDTVANLICLALYELAANPSIQKTLHEEIDASVEENGDSLGYDVLQKLSYLDMIISETLRKWPPSIITDRICTKEFTLEPSKEGSNDGIKLNLEDLVIIPIHSIHHDPKYWPNPEKFDPERFSDENKNNIIPYTYLPFGAGPRNCIGSRYALMEAKVLVYMLMSKFDIKVNEKKTSVPLKLSLTTFNLGSKTGYWIHFAARK